MTILETIVAQKRIEVGRLPCHPVDRATLRLALAQRDPFRDFFQALRAAARSASPALIAEVKKASPSAGLIRPDFDPVAIATAYTRAGAAALSVLTDEQFFQGSLTYLRQIRAATPLPLLRKDFIIDPRQILEAVQWGADAILLIVAILDDAQLRHFLELAHGVGLTALVEVHDETELDRALAAGARLMGVNNRDLRNFQVDLGTTERLAARLRSAAAHAPAASTPPLLVAESGIHCRQDVERLARCGADAILVGESLMRHSDLTAKIAELLGRSPV